MRHLLSDLVKIYANILYNSLLITPYTQFCYQKKKKLLRKLLSNIKKIYLCAKKHETSVKCKNHFVVNFYDNKQKKSMDRELHGHKGAWIRHSRLFWIMSLYWFYVVESSLTLELSRCDLIEIWSGDKRLCYWGEQFAPFSLDFQGSTDFVKVLKIIFTTRTVNVKNSPKLGTLQRISASHKILIEIP
jgi:hypothetical protein